MNTRSPSASLSSLEVVEAPRSRELAGTPSSLRAGASASAPRAGLPKAWLAVGALAVAGIASAAFLAGRSSQPGTETPSAAPTKQLAQAAPEPTAAPSPSAESCTHCGVVESVQAVERKGEGTGVGAVAGGVVGGVLGNQVGGGNGRAAMTVIGAVGGGLAGHEMEKRARSVTVYRVKVRMDDGSLRTIEQPQSIAAGQKVRVDGKKLHLQTGTTTAAK